jgi:hypothetical protein
LSTTSPEGSAASARAEDRGGASRDDPVASFDAATTARTRLLDVELMLRDAWYATIEPAPQLAARIDRAARLARQAAEALASDTLL